MYTTSGVNNVCLNPYVCCHIYIIQSVLDRSSLKVFQI